MRQFFAYRNRNEHTRRLYPVLLNVQSDLIEGTGTRVVVPMASMAGERKPPLISSLTPVLQVGGKPYALLVPLLASVEIADLGSIEGDLSTSRNAIINALDLLIQGI